MPFIEDEVAGKKGRYAVTVSDSQKSLTDVNAELVGDLVIEYGELSRSPVKQVLKSYVRLRYTDEQLIVHEVFRGGFSEDRFRVVIDGPGVLWKGTVKEETRTLPFDNRIRKETTELRCYGGITKARMEPPQKEELTFVGREYQIQQMTEQLTLGSGCGERIRSDTVLKRRDDTLHEVASTSSPFRTHPVNMYRSGDAYEALKEWAKIEKGVVYRSLSENDIIYDVVRLFGVSGAVQGRDPGEDPVSEKQRGEFINVIDVDNLITGRAEDGLRDLKRVGRIVVKFEKEANIGLAGAVTFTDPDNDTVNWEHPPNRSFVSSDFYGDDVTKNIRFRVGYEDSNNTETITLHLGRINPNEALGIIVTWDPAETEFNPDLELKYRGNDGSVVTQSDVENNSILQGPTTIDVIDPILNVTGNTGEISLKVRYIDSNDRIVEDLIGDSDQSGVEDIEIENPNPPLVDESDGIESKEAKQIQVPPRSISQTQPSLFQAELERDTRPFGTKTARGRIEGIYGPEYLHEIELDNKKTFWVSTGLKCNLTTGITDVALVEIPNHNLS